MRTWLSLMVAVTAGCGDTPLDGASAFCDLPTAFLAEGGPGVDGIPSLQDPPLVEPTHPDAAYVRDGDRIIGLVIDGEAVAIPLNIGWWHEVVHVTVGGQDLLVTHCPLTGSSLVFDRATVGGVAFGVSGLLFMSNLVLFDRGAEPSLWPQMARGARCGPARGSSLTMVGAVEMRWDAWRRLHPETRVVSDETGFARDYQRYPYGSYDQLNNISVTFPVPGLDPRRLPKERVLGVPDGEGGVAFPFLALDALGAVAQVPVVRPGQSYVVFWDRAAQAAIAVRPQVDGQSLTFTITDGSITDRQTGSVWDVMGVAQGGPLTGRRLPLVPEAYVAFWFAWSLFEPDAALWTGP
ncbi:MAG: DUF3179 domain-containing protein [Gemmatimonadales bacterium]